MPTHTIVVLLNIVLQMYSVTDTYEIKLRCYYLKSEQQEIVERQVGMYRNISLADNRKISQNPVRLVKSRM